jgi:hypothetical protein
MRGPTPSTSTAREASLLAAIGTTDQMSEFEEA